MIFIGNRNPSLHGKAIRCVRNLMTTHDLDTRYVDPETRARVAVLYLPLLGIVMDAIPQLYAYLQDTHDTLNHIGFLDDYQGPQNSEKLYFLFSWSVIQYFDICQKYNFCFILAVTTTTISSEVAYAISGSRLYSFSPEPTKMNKSTLSSENTRHLLSCFAWILKNLDKSVLQRYEIISKKYRIKF